MTQKFNIHELLTSRAGQRSFHVAAEEHVRIEFRNLASGEAVERFSYAGDVVLTCYRGAFSVRLADGTALPIAPLDQVVVPAQTAVRLECVEDGTVQFIWAPGHAATEQG